MDTRRDRYEEPLDEEKLAILRSRPYQVRLLVVRHL
jgi:hypothetical protein